MRGAIAAMRDHGLHTDALAFNLPLYFALLLVLDSLALENRQVYLAAGLAAGLETIIVRQVGLDPSLLLASVLGMTAVAALATQTSARAVRLVQGVSTEQLRRERLGRYFSPQVAARLAE